MKSLWSLRTGARARTVSQEFTRENVRAWLRSSSDTRQARLVRGEVERVGLYLHDPRLHARYKGLENYHRRLPSILSLYLRGRSVEEIAEQYKPVFTAYGVDHSLDILCEHIAYRLNRSS
ncbi:MAG: hypothetical protein M3281_01680 [Chloroflexota bacterium]|nr:hypothetical protein [Chloroflexota bacterium]